jgi:hypothetical protein
MPKVLTYEKDPSEPDGFRLPDPEPSQAVGLGRCEIVPSGKGSTEILAYLSQQVNGVAAIQDVMKATGRTKQSVKMIAGRCLGLRILDGDRVALNTE